MAAALAEDEPEDEPDAEPFEEPALEDAAVEELAGEALLELPVDDVLAPEPHAARSSAAARAANVEAALV